MSRKQTEQIDIHSESSSSGLNDINAKNSLALINQLCNQYKIKVEYDLVDVKGPENDRLFEGYKFHWKLVLRKIIVFFLLLFKFL